MVWLYTDIAPLAFRITISLPPRFPPWAEFILMTIPSSDATTHVPVLL